MSQETERPFLPMSWELGGDFMSGMADSIRERRAREVPGWEGVVEEAFDEWEEEEEWEDDEWEEEEWEASLTEKVLNAVEALLPRLADFIIDVATIALIPTTLTLLAIVSQKTSFDLLDTGLLLFGATVATLTIANAKTRLLQRLRLRFR
jgi:hypothetical protein